MNELIFFFNNVLVAGVVLGSIYAVGAIGVTLIFGILRFAHFAHGDMMTMGGFIALPADARLAGRSASRCRGCRPASSSCPSPWC